MEYSKVSKEIFDPIKANKAKFQEKFGDQLAELFPSAVKDGVVDFSSLLAELGQYVDAEERYELNWAGKTDAKRIANSDIVGKTLKFVSEESKDPESTQNLYIEGDNLEVLKLLRNNYFNSIKMIYIDPPYNTGKDFIYKDNFTKADKDIAIEEGDIDSDGNRLVINQKSNGKYHSNWLNMIYPRLKIAKELLTDDGVIFISIDDNEAASLKKVCDEIFGEENHVETFYLQVRYSNKSLTEKDYFQKLIEQVYVYSKGGFIPNRPSEAYTLDKFKYKIIEKAKGTTASIGGREVTIFKDGEYEIVEVEPNIDGLKETWASGTVLTGNASGKYFDKYLSSRVSIDGLGTLYKVNGIGEDGLGYRYFTGPKREGATKGKFYSGVPLERREEIETGGSTKYKPIVNFYDYAAKFGNIRHEGEVDFRGGKKPIALIQELIKMSTDDNDLILDFFAGSSSTAHAVMDLNAQEGTSRNFIMVQIAEPIDINSDYYRAGFKTISDLSKERIRRAGEQVKKEFSHIENLDIGFKVFKVADTNIRWFSEAIMSDILDYDMTMTDKDTLDFNPGFTDIDVVYEILLRHRDIPLSTTVEQLSNIGRRTYIFADTVVVCLEETITEEMINKIAAIEPMPTKIIFRDSAFGDDISLKENTMIRLEAQMRKNSGLEKRTYRVEFI
ncbi:site-specific DNA-methyltransferase [Paenibacillus thailandensis]|uniref:Site-specific DNA-methyltransferase n=1 Tax=Paenibacillus thailandensis TaxID=393250 RepID=A0ABW5QZM2_9BACL